MTKKTFIFIQTFFFYFVGYVWYFSLYLIILPYLVLLVGKNLDRLVFQYFFNLNSVFYFDGLSLVIALILLVIGGLLILWSFYTLYFYSKCFPFTVSLFFKLKPKKLAMSGPYSLVRHPMALGYLVVLVAFGFYQGSLMVALWVVPLLFFIFYEYIHYREEKILSSWFGKEFEEYKKKTPFFFPKFLRKQRRQG